MIRQELSGRQREMAAFRRRQFEEHVLKQLFLELTLRCNLLCKHCGSRCGEEDLSARRNELSADEWKRIIDQVAEDFPRKPQINITGGEPLLRSDFEEILGYVHEKGFRWGMTTNATLITPEVARMLYRTGMGTISVSLDGFQDSHDAFRSVSGSWLKAMDGINNLLDVRREMGSQKAFRHIQITSVFNHNTIAEMPAMFDFIKDMDIDSYRIIGIEPIGRAMDHDDLSMTAEDQRRLLSFIVERRMEGWPVSYGCSHYLGSDYEGLVRNWMFYCMAGINVASIMADGKIASCLDIDRSAEETIFGNIRTDRLRDVWESGFGIYRRDRGEDDPVCMKCSDREYCMGGSAHTWDFSGKRQRLCVYNLIAQATCASPFCREE